MIMLRNQKGMVLIIAYMVVLVLAVLSAAFFMRAFQGKKLSQQQNDSMKAFYEAEAGIAYAYFEESKVNFSWYTHVDKDTRNIGQVMPPQGTTISFVVPIPRAPNSSIGPDGLYRVSNRRFAVKSYPEVINGSYSEVIVIHSQATVNGITRTVEYRLGQVSPYQFFLFYPTDQIFDTAIYDGRNYASIHVNGDIYFRNNPEFRYLVSLTCAGQDGSGKGYIIRPLNYKYADLDPAGSSGERAYSTGSLHQQHLANEFRLYSTSHFYTGNTIFKIGPVDNIDANNTKTLYYYLDDSAAYPAQWSYDKYAGSGTKPVHYTISDTNLKNLAAYELTRSDLVANSLLDSSKTVNVPDIGSGTEGAIFKQLYNNSGTTAVQWDDFWTDWRANHQNDYLAYHSGSGLTGGSDWERRFFVAAYNWSGGMGDGVPDTINREWWEDLGYGNDLTSDRKGLARVESSSTGLPLEQYFLNTKEQTSAWAAWLAVNSLNEAGENKTLIQDVNQGAKYINPGDVLGTDRTSELKQQARNGGVYIGIKDGVFDNPIPDYTQVKQFYNAVRPARSGSKYKPSRVLQIDVKMLWEKIQADKLSSNGPLKDFNGIIYIDLDSYPWPAGYNADSNADGVILVNAERLPDNGLSIVTPNNVFINGNYNLDPNGDLTKNRKPDDTVVIDWIKARKTYLNNLDDPSTPNINEAGLKWQPAEIITQRQVYTLSEDFPAPQAMPLSYAHYYQYYDWSSGYTDVNIIGHPRWGTPGASWMPTGWNWSSKITQWAQNNPGNPPQWTIEWINNNWGAYDSADSFVYKYNTDDSDPSNDVYILRQDLKADLYSKVYSCYNAAYAYKSSNPADAYQRANPVTLKHIYNTAIVSPHSTDPLVLENWSTTRIIDGAFILLPADLQLSVPTESYVPSGRYSNPSKTLLYETRFGRNSLAADRPRTGLTFGAESSWRELASSEF